MIGKKEKDFKISRANRLNNKKSKSLKDKLHYIIISMLIAMVGCIILILWLLGFYASRYSRITHNVNVCSNFNINFKENLDLKMYHFSIGSNEQKELPVTDVDDAIIIAKSLSETTERKESKQAIENVIDYCNTLIDRMYTLEKTQEYDIRQKQLDNNIRVLTKLIQNQMMDYIYYEAGNMALVEQSMAQSVRILITILTILITLVVVFLMHRSLKLSDGITVPISKLRENVRQVGHGNFNIPEIESEDYEIADLDAGIQKMAKRINRLINDIKEEENLQHKMQLQLLQAQISPHFLYNTLDTIMWLIELGKQQEAVKMVTDLSVFFRTALSKGEDIIRLEEEIMHTKSYLDIQHVRYVDILDYTITLPEELKNVMLPKLTLQPIAENALYHGVKEKRGKSSIDIECISVGDSVKITIKDTGIGMSTEKLAEIQQAINSGTRIGFGMSAVQERIKLYCGEEYGMTINSCYGMGTTIQIIIPKECTKGGVTSEK